MSARHWLVSLFRPALHFVAYYPLLTALVAVVIATCWGGIMADYDAVHVIWNDHPFTGVLNGVGVALVLGQLVLAAYLLDRSRRLRALALYRDWPAGRHFQPREPLPRTPPWAYWATWLLLLAVVAFPAVVRGGWFRISNVAGTGPWEITDVVRTDDPAAKQEVEYVERRAGAFRTAMALARVWFPLGLGVTAVAVGAAWLALHKAFPVRKPVPGAPRRTRFQRALRVYALRMFRGPVYFAWTLFVALAVGYLVMVVAHSVKESAFCPTYPASVSILFLAGFLAGVAWRFTALAGRRVWLYPVVLALPVVLFRWSDAQTEYRVPGMAVRDATGGSYYGREAQLKGYEELHQKPAAEFGLVPDDVALTAWEARMKQVFRGEFQPVVVVAVSGGASASALYVADVLYTLEEQFPGFADRVRVISGASGGMLGAAYFVTQLREGGLVYQTRTSAEYRRYFEAQEKLDGIVERGEAGDPAAVRKERDEALAAFRELARARRAVFFRGLEEDFLSPLVQKWVHKDMPLYFFPGATTNDRGAALEAAWSRYLKQNPLGPANGPGALDVPFTTLRADEKNGLIPSLVFSPMMVEDGRQLLISNLDLNYMIDTRGPAQPAGAPDSRPTEDPGNLLSVTGMEFFRLFPKADEFRLGTAVRLNASFPYFSPLATLPTNPARHVVDAGYYDNYGTNVATKWIAQHANHLAARAKGQDRPAVILLRIRCFEFEGQKRQFLTQPEVKGLESAKPGEVVHTNTGLFTLTAPLAGLFSAWRANMVYRGDERVAAVDALLASKKARFQYPITECRVNPSLNWVLTPDTKVRIHTDAWIQTRLPSAVANVIQGRTTEPPASLPTGVAKAARAEGRKHPGPIGDKATSTVVQSSQDYQRATVPEKQVLVSLADLANVLVNLNLADPDAPPPGK